MASWPGMQAGSSAEVYVEYQRPSNQREEWRAWCANDWLLNQLQPGAPVHIAYKDEEPDRVVLLEAFVR
jgi:hypothetical protein